MHGTPNLVMQTITLKLKELTSLCI